VVQVGDGQLNVLIPMKKLSRGLMKYEGKNAQDMENIGVVDIFA
jgi:hypothetical protein